MYGIFWFDEGKKEFVRSKYLCGEYSSPSIAQQAIDTDRKTGYLAFMGADDSVAYCPRPLTQNIILN